MRTKWIPFVSLVVFAVMSVACSSGPPLIESLEVDLTPSESVPLAALLTFQSDRPTTVRFEFDDGRQSWSHETRLAAATDHVVPILGMKPDRPHDVRLIVTDQNGETATSEPIEITTGPLPDDFPPIDVRVSQPDRMEPGFTLVELEYSPEDGSEQEHQWLIALDELGEIVWYYRARHGVSDAQRLRNGNLLYRSGRTRLYEIDMLGNIVSQWNSQLAPREEQGPESFRVSTDTLHHEALETPEGNILAISTEVRAYDDYPTSETDPTAPRSTSDVVGDVLVEFTRAGEIVREIRLLDFLDPYRIGYGSLGAFWTETYPRRANPLRDWTHANGVALDESGRYLLVSLRHQDAVVKMDLATEELVWVLGDHGDWGNDWRHLLLEPRGDMTWPYHQHAPMFTPQGTILIFDNGNFRARPFEEPMAPSESFSRAVEYVVDEESMEVREVWSYGGPEDERFYGFRVGDADWLPDTGNVLINYGGLSSDADGNSISAANAHNWVRIVEVTHENPAQKVFEVFIDDERPSGWLSFQAERIPSLYP